MIILLTRYRGHAIKVLRNNYGPGSHEYEWQIRGPHNSNDPTSWRSRNFTLYDAKMEVDNDLPVLPRRFLMRRNYIKCVGFFSKRISRMTIKPVKKGKRG